MTNRFQLGRLLGTVLDVRCPSQECAGHKDMGSAASNPTDVSSNDTQPSACPVPQRYRSPAVYNVYNQRVDGSASGSPLDPRNNMPLDASNRPSAGQRSPLSTCREISSIPKGGTDGTWLYPSPQMFYNGQAVASAETALLRWSFSTARLNGWLCLSLSSRIGRCLVCDSKQECGVSILLLRDSLRVTILNAITPALCPIGVRLDKAKRAFISYPAAPPSEPNHSSDLRLYPIT